MTEYRAKAKYDRLIFDGSPESTVALNAWGLELDSTMTGVHVFRDTETEQVVAILGEQDSYATYEPIAE